MGKLSLVHVAARSNAESNNAFQPEKVSAAVYPSRLHGREPQATWLKSREIKALKTR
jgi:hypothetical protein